MFQMKTYSSFLSISCLREKTTVCYNVKPGFLLSEDSYLAADWKGVGLRKNYYINVKCSNSYIMFLAGDFSVHTGIVWGREPKYWLEKIQFVNF
jgi:hypothetical protein